MNALPLHNGIVQPVWDRAVMCVTWYLHINLFVCMYVCIHVCSLYVCMCVYMCAVYSVCETRPIHVGDIMCVCIYSCTCIRVCAHVLTCLCVCACVCTCTGIFVCISMYIDTRISRYHFGPDLVYVYTYVHQNLCTGTCISMLKNTFVCLNMYTGVATISGLLNIIGFFLQKSPITETIFCKSHL